MAATKTIITHDEIGRLVQAGNREQLFDALDVMVTSPEIRSQLGQVGWRTFQERYSAVKYISMF